MWCTVWNLWKCVAFSRTGTHLKYSVNTALCRGDEFETMQRSQNTNVTRGSDGIVLLSDEGKRLIDYIFRNAVLLYFLHYWYDKTRFHVKRGLFLSCFSSVLARVLLEEDSTTLEVRGLCFWSFYEHSIWIQKYSPSFCVWAKRKKDGCSLWCCSW